LAKLFSDPELRRRMGEVARARAAKDFAMQDVTRRTLDFYRQALNLQTAATA